MSEQICATLGHRLECRGVKVSRTAEYLCALESALDLARAAFRAESGVHTLGVFHTAPHEIEHDDVVLAKDLAGNVAVLWRHDNIWDVLVTYEHGFGHPVAVCLIGSIAEPIPERAVS